MKTIYKYTLSPAQEVYKIPSSNILSAIIQGCDIQVYAIVDTSEQAVENFYSFKVIGTGSITSIDLERYTFLNTVQLDNLVFHVFYKKLT